MNDDDLTRLASAYLDDETTAEERARVEADPEVLAGVDRLRAVRALLADVEPAAISLRETHLAGALDAWDRIPETERTGVLRDATPHGSSRRRSPSARWLSAAAAGLVAVLAGGVLLQVNRSADDTDSNSAGDTAATAQVESAPAEPLLDASESDDPTIAADSELTQLESDAGATADGGDIDTRIDNPAPPSDTDLVVLLDADDLALFASDAIDAPTSPDVPAATSAPADPDAERDATEAAIPKCPGVDIVVGPAMYRDTAVVVGIDEGSDLALAHTTTDCVEIARARMP